MSAINFYLELVRPPMEREYPVESTCSVPHISHSFENTLSAISPQNDEYV